MVTSHSFICHHSYRTAEDCFWLSSALRSTIFKQSFELIFTGTFLVLVWSSFGGLRGLWSGCVRCLWAFSWQFQWQYPQPWPTSTAGDIAVLVELNNTLRALDTSLSSYDGILVLATWFTVLQKEQTSVVNIVYRQWTPENFFPQCRWYWLTPAIRQSCQYQLAYT